MTNPLSVLVVMVSLSTLIMIGINVYLMLTVKKERTKTVAIKENLATLSAAIHKRLENQGTAVLTSAQPEDLESFLSSIEKDLNQISQKN